MIKNSIKSQISTLFQKCDILDIELIIAHVLKKDRVFIVTYPEYKLTQKEQTKITALCDKRANDYPLAYIIGNKEFYNRTFIVSENTLVPRPETELLVSNVISFVTQNNNSDTLIIDIGTGTGIIPITLSKELIQHNISSTILATDISLDALNIAKLNAKSNNVTNIKFYISDLLQNIELYEMILATSHNNIIITANLPYVDNSIKNTLLNQPESKALKYEPSIALWSKDSGLHHYKKLINHTIQLHNQLSTTKNIISFYEIDPDQSSLLTKYFDTKISKDIKLIYTKDLSKKDRTLQWTLK